VTADPEAIAGKVRPWAYDAVLRDGRSRAVGMLKARPTASPFLLLGSPKASGDHFVETHPRGALETSPRPRRDGPATIPA